MKYQISGNIVPCVTIKLKEGESIFTQSGGMFYQSEGISMKTNTKGGLLKGLTRTFAGESLFLTTYTAKQDDAFVSIASTMPGAILPLDVSEKSFIIQKGAFLAAECNVELKTTFTKKLSVGVFSGEGFIMQKISRKSPSAHENMAFLEIDGDMVVIDLKDQEVLKIDTGNLVGMEESVKYEIEVVKGLGNVIWAGEGLFLTKVTGPGRVIMQTCNIQELSSRIGAYINFDVK